MATKSTTGSSADGWTAEERAAMKERAAELRAEGKKGAKKADGLQAVVDAIAKMAPDDRALAEPLGEANDVDDGCVAHGSSPTLTGWPGRMLFWSASVASVRNTSRERSSRE